MMSNSYFPAKRLSKKLVFKKKDLKDHRIYWYGKIIEVVKRNTTHVYVVDNTDDENIYLTKTSIKNRGYIEKMSINFVKQLLNNE